MTKSCTAPPSTTPKTIQSMPGEVAELRGQHGAHQRAGAGDGGEVVAEEDAARRRHEVAAVAEPLGGGRARVGSMPSTLEARNRE